MYKKTIIKWSLLTVLLLSFIGQARADEGMWLLALLKKNNAKEMKAMGLNIPIEKITGEDGALSESVVGFGSGCTGSIISGSGLILTNYHCAYSAIQQYVSPTNDIFQNGYWAKTEEQELRVNDLIITVNKKILDISDEVKAQLQNSTSEAGNVRKAMEAVSQKYQQQYPKYKILIKPYKNNSLFVLFIQLQYSDVRFVGVAPKNVTKFGGETDNWMWPRHSADFAFFRIYADKNGAPAAYSKTNVPLVVKNYLHISKEGYKKDDFAMSMGYSGMSDRNATSSQIWQKTQVLNPPLIAVRKLRQSILEDEMAKSGAIKQLYAEKYATSANYYKNAVGMNFWVNKLNILAKKEAFEKGWMNWVMQDEAKKARYSTILQDLKTAIEGNAKFKRAQTYYFESFGQACELTQFLKAFGKAFYTYPQNVKNNPEIYKNLSTNTRFYYTKINMNLDKRVAKAMLKLIKDSLPADLQPEIVALKNLNTTEQVDQYIDEVFKTSVFADSAKLQNWLRNPSVSLENDPLVQLAESIDKKDKEIFRIAESNARKIYRIGESYYNSLAEYKGGSYYPDADKTIRLSYGTISDLQVDGKTIPYQSTFSGLIAKAADTANKDYYLNKKLQTIWQNKDFGRYGTKGDMPVCFVTNGDVTGGNSGSPMLNADGKIIGLVFDCNWESMTREFNFEKDLHKVICVDIRYLLFLTDKFSSTGRITAEIAKANPGWSM
ncbi:S46 family peptidase [Solitalea koreensis]|uniref:Dipeptidyl-peptidase n=1 Tax=Solitalea koreensis TaxID=543615 RepID=A0A521AAS8_9SPHI|nr:S46 family peptidase [Solitalea koreensis]SMO31896.1 Peptidase S46 [Solitalea koreensis]